MSLQSKNFEDGGAQVNEFLKKLTTSISNFWKNASILKKGIGLAVIAAIIIAIAMTCKMSSKPSGVRIFNSQIKDENALSKILDRISSENIRADATDDGYILVDDEKIAKTLRSTLISEGLVPSSVDPFAGFYKREWSTTDKEQNIKLKNAMTKQVKDHIEAINGINSANVSIVLPEKQIFIDAQNPVTASVILNFAPNSDIPNNKRRIQGIQNIILSAVEGLKADNLVIADSDGNELNDFEGMLENDRINLIEKQQKLKRKLEIQKKSEVLKALQNVMSEDRITDLNINIDFDMSEETIEATEYTPITKKVDNPNTPYDDSEIIDTLPVSEQIVDKTWQGTGYNPEGPAGVEGQTPPVYSDMSNVVGKNVEHGITRNNAVNSKKINKKVAPQTGKTTVSFNADGKWIIKRDRNGNYVRKTQEEIDAETETDPTFGLVLKWVYIPVDTAVLDQLKKLAEGAIGYDQVRGDIVNVGSISADHSKEHEDFENAYFQAQQNKRTLILVLVVVAVLLVGFVAFRMISKEMERRRRIREEELLRQQQAEREKALWDARENTDNQVTMSVEDTRRAELQETAVNLAKEHPEDVAMLIRTWLMEE